MKILHVASFRGNIGDNASHLGFYSILNRLSKNHSIEKIEIRNFYKNCKNSDKRIFDKEFINYLNKFDITIIGGGGFLDYWVPGSQTGATFDIDPYLVSGIKKPTLFTSMGCNPQKSVPDGNIEKFRRFLVEVSENEKTSIAVRNDGSLKAIEQDFGKEFLTDIVEILDHGFFYHPSHYGPDLLHKDYVAINIVNDQLDMRSSLKGVGSKKSYLEQLKYIVIYVVTHLNLDILFVPHIYSDLKAISDFLEILDDSLIRKHITVAPCVQGDGGAEYIFSLYRNSKFVLGTRLHANICSIAMEKKSIGLAALDRVEYLYRSLEIENRTVKLSDGFGETVTNILSGDDFYESRKLDDLRTATVEYYENALGSL